MCDRFRDIEKRPTGGDGSAEAWFFKHGKREKLSEDDLVWIHSDFCMRCDYARKIVLPKEGEERKWSEKKVVLNWMFPQSDANQPNS